MFHYPQIVLFVLLWCFFKCAYKSATGQSVLSSARRTIPETHGKELCQLSTPGHRPRANSSNISGYIFSSWGWQDRLGLMWSFIVPAKSLDFIPNVIKKELKNFGKENDEVWFNDGQDPSGYCMNGSWGPGEEWKQRAEQRGFCSCPGEELGCGLWC